MLTKMALSHRMIYGNESRDVKWIKEMIYRMALKKFGYEMAEDEAAEIIKSHSNASDMYIRWVLQVINNIKLLCYFEATSNSTK